jgi:hypothetical protein
LERQNKELKANLAELETAQKTKNKVNIAASETKNNNVKSNDRQAAGKYKSLLLPLQIVGTIPPYGGNS